MDVVCLHGLGRTPADWDGVAPRLARLGEVRAPVVPGRLADAERELVGAVGPRTLLIGHSLGGVLALRLAAARPVAGLVLTGCFFPPSRDGRPLGVTLRDYLGHRVAYLRTVGRSGAAATPGSLAQLARVGLGRRAFAATAAAVRVPVLVIHARDDHHVPIAFARAAVARQPGWVLRELDAGGHHAHVTRPGAWADAAVASLG